MDEKINDEKALDCRDAIIDLKEQESKLIEQRFNNVKDEYDAILKQFEHTHSMLEGAIDITETSGYIVSTKYYDSLISNENEKINKLYAEREALVNSLNSALSSGKIDKYSESWYNMQNEIDLLDTNKDMYDYQKQLAEKQKEISSIEKQLAAYQGDTSEEGASKRQQLQNDLNDAKQDLAETQYERSIADQKKLLDDLYEQYEEVLNMRLDNIDVLVSDVIANVNSEAGAIRDTLEAKADSVGYTMTESMNTIWNSANQVITNYGTNFLSSITGVQNAINDLTNLIKQAVDASNKKASASSSSTKKPSSSTPASQPAKPTPKPATTSSGDGVPNVGDAVTFNSGAYYYSSDGLSPTGTQMHGQTVYITRVNNASWAKKKYHIAKDRNATHPLGWVDLS